MKNKTNPVVNRMVLINGGATAPTVQLYQRKNNRCRIWWYALDPTESGTIATFECHDWKKAIVKAVTIVDESLKAVRA